jgi:hypothetical protein
LLLKVYDPEEPESTRTAIYRLRRADMYRSSAKGVSDWEAFFGDDPPEGSSIYRVPGSPFLLLSRGGAWYVGRGLYGFVQKGGGDCTLKDVRSGDGGAPLLVYACANGGPERIVPASGFTRVRSFRFLAPGDDYAKAFSK